ncbi:MAG: hypothetical protein QOK21_1140 [Solirubrobacteraceae bacterium]|nr:hypothetical protein [Solirubrobacteraceae bacterium]
MTGAQLRARRWAAQWLDRGGARTPAAVAGAVLAIQAQDAFAARRAIRARAAGVTAAEVDAALAGGSLVVSWLMRGTLHLVRAEDLPWLHGLTAPGRFTANARRLGRLGVGPDAAERALALIERTVADDGPQRREALVARLAGAGIPTAGQAPAHLLGLAALRGVVVLDGGGGGPARYARWRDRLAEPPQALDGDARERALAELARRYLEGHGPATGDDLARWSGLGLRDARAGLRAIGAELTDHGQGLVELAARAAREAQPPAPRLLGAFDPYVLGWRDRSFLVAEAHARRVHPGAGILRAVAAVDGRAVATWTARRAGGRLDVELDPFGPIAAPARAALDCEARDVARFEGLEPA